MPAVKQTMLQISTESGVKLKSFGNETLLFHSASGDTLLLSPVAVPMIQHLQEGPVEKEDLFNYLADTLNYELDGSFVMHMEEILLGLFERDIVVAQ